MIETFHGLHLNPDLHLTFKPILHLRLAIGAVRYIAIGYKIILATNLKEMKAFEESKNFDSLLTSHKL